MIPGKKRKVMITGGHLTPAVSTINVLRRRHPDWDIIFVGRRIALEGTKTLSEEYRLICAMHIPFLPLIAGRLKRDGGIAAFVTLGKVPIGFIQALWYVATRRPSVIVSFGGYVALPVVLSGWIFRIPVVTHEQTRKPGLSNRIIARLAGATCVSFPDGVSGLPCASIYTGLPLRESVFHPPLAPSWKVSKDKGPLLLIVGGSTGSVSINTVMYDALSVLLKTYTVIHQVGRISLPRALEVKRGLKQSSDQYIVMPYLSEADYSWALHHATLIIGRSGANTVMEIAATGKIAIFVPLPWAAENEQYYNALFLKDAGSAEIIAQDVLSPGSLMAVITEMMQDLFDRMRCAKDLATTIPRDGASRFVRVIEDLMQ